MLMEDDVEKRCCLGFVCEQAGITKDRLLNVASPKLIRGLMPRVPEPLKFLVVDPGLFHSQDLPLAIAAMEINDCEQMGEEEREKRLQDLFSEHDVELVFIN